MHHKSQVVVSERHHPSITETPPQYQSDTTLVSERNYPSVRVTPESFKEPFTESFSESFNESSSHAPTPAHTREADPFSPWSTEPDPRDLETTTKKELTEKDNYGVPLKDGMSWDEIDAYSERRKSQELTDIYTEKIGHQPSPNIQRLLDQESISFWLDVLKHANSNITQPERYLRKALSNRKNPK